MTSKDRNPRTPAAEAVEAEFGTPHETPEPQPTGEPGTIRETRAPGETGETGSATDTEVDARLEELHDRWLRAVAELDNLRKRTARDLARQRLDERARVAAEWLPVIDNLELALRHADADAD